MSSTDVDFTRRKQMGIIAHEEAELMSEKSRLEVFNDILKLSWEEIEMGNTIGFGGFSQVFKVRITRPNEAGEFDDTEYALKCLNPSTMNRTKRWEPNKDSESARGRVIPWCIRVCKTNLLISCATLCTTVQFLRVPRRIRMDVRRTKCLARMHSFFTSL